MSSACAQLGILAVGLIAARHNAACVSMTPFSSAGIHAKSVCYGCRAYAPQTRARPPAAQTEDASSTVVKPAMGARMNGCSILRSSVKRRLGHIGISRLFASRLQVEE